VRPQEGTGFAWLVIPGLGVGTSPSSIAGTALGDLRSHLPVAYSGQVTVPGKTVRQPVPGALIRGYIYMSGGAYTADSTRADSILQIAETRSDEMGGFDLLIPAALNVAPE
jgi:hypothetical protein